MFKMGFPDGFVGIKVCLEKEEESQNDELVVFCLEAKLCLVKELVLGAGEELPDDVFLAVEMPIISDSAKASLIDDVRDADVVVIFFLHQAQKCFRDPCRYIFFVHF